MSKKLNDKELHRINELDAAVELAKEKLKSTILETKIIEMQTRILAFEMEKKKAHLEILRKEESNNKEVRADFLKQIAKKKGLPNGWGFNPDSGEIIEGEQ